MNLQIEKIVKKISVQQTTNSEDGTTKGETGAIATTNITGLSYIKGTSYAGGFAGRLMPGDVALDRFY